VLSDAMIISGHYLVVATSRDTGRTNRLWISDLRDSSNPIGSNMKWHKIVDKFESEYNLVANDGSKLYIQTNADGASNDKIVLYDLEHPEKVSIFSLRQFDEQGRF
jgi:prolyl oligopeptidase